MSLSPCLPGTGLETRRLRYTTSFTHVNGLGARSLVYDNAENKINLYNDVNAANTSNDTNSSTNVVSTTNDANSSNGAVDTDDIHSNVTGSSRKNVVLVLMEAQVQIKNRTCFDFFG